MSDSSSQDLHPAHGGRFVLTRVGSEDDPLVYEVAVYLPDAQRLDTRMRWVDGRPQLDPAVSDAWAEGEILKLARVLGRTPRASLTRWRGR